MSDKPSDEQRSLQMTKIESLKELAGKATPGPWFLQYGDDSDFMCMTAISASNARSSNQGQFTHDENLIAITYHQSYPFTNPDDTDDNNGAYIAAANPSAILKLLSELAAARAEIAQFAAAVHAGIEALEGWIFRSPARIHKLDEDGYDTATERADLELDKQYLSQLQQLRGLCK